MKTYVIEWDYQGKNHGTYWEIHRHHTFEAENKAEARKQFDEWHEEHGAKNERGKLRHPFHIEIHRI